MAATIVAFVCEDRQDYELMKPSTTENPKKGKPFSSALSHPYSRPIRVANVQEFFSLKMFYDVLLCFTLISLMSYHRHAGNVLSKVDIACGQFVLYHCSDNMPVDATVFCRFVTSCIVTCQKSHYGILWRMRRLTKTHKIPIPPTANTTY